MNEGGKKRRRDAAAISLLQVAIINRVVVPARLLLPISPPLSHFAPSLTNDEWLFDVVKRYRNIFQEIIIIGILSLKRKDLGNFWRFFLFL